MLLLLTGHPRSGTEMLLHTLNSHPEVALTLELGSLRTLWVPPRMFALNLLDGWRSAPMPVLQRSGQRQRGWSAALTSVKLVTRMLWEVRRFRHRQIGPTQVEELYRAALPGFRVVGDKLPNYSLALDQFAQVSGLKCVVIQRHPFAVIQSYLKLISSHWRNIPSLSRLDSAEKVAAQWAECQEQWWRNRRSVLTLRYEEMLVNPTTELVRLGDWLGLDPAGFSQRALPRPRPAVRLGAEVEARVLAICRPHLERMGYPEIPDLR